MKAYLGITLIAIALLIPTLAQAAANDELTFSASLFSPKNGEDAWAASGEYLIGVGGNFLLGPSVGVFDTGSANGQAFGLAGEVGIGGKKSGLFVGAAVHKLEGDVAADYSGEARVGLKLGGERGFAKLFATQTWTRSGAGELTDPEGTAFVAAVGLRFGK